MSYSRLGVFFVMFLSRAQDPASEAWDDQLEGDIEIHMEIFQGTKVGAILIAKVGLYYDPYKWGCKL